VIGGESGEDGADKGIRAWWIKKC